MRSLRLLLLLLALPLPALASDAARPPNVLFIYLDDLGWRDAGFMDSDFYDQEAEARAIRATTTPEL